MSGSGWMDARMMCRWTRRACRLAVLAAVTAQGGMASAQHAKVLGATERGATQQALPDVPTLMREVQAHQRQLDTIREMYTYTSTQTTEDLDANGRVKKTESTEAEDFFVNGHVIERQVKRDGQPLSAHDAEKEQERVAKMVEKAQQTPPGQPLRGQTISVSRLLEIMAVSNERRVEYHGRPTIAFDFVGRKDAKTHGILEDASKKLRGTIWIDEADRQVARLEVTFMENFRVGGGLLANVEKGSNFGFDQAPVPREKEEPRETGADARTGGQKSDELWLPTGAEGTMDARVLLLKTMRQHFVERDTDFKRFRVETEQTDKAQVKQEKR